MSETARRMRKSQLTERKPDGSTHLTDAADAARAAAISALPWRPCATDLGNILGYAFAEFLTLQWADPQTLTVDAVAAEAEAFVRHWATTTVRTRLMCESDDGVGPAQGRA